MIQRMIGAALFNAQTYEEIEADQSALGQAIGVVILVTICGIVGGIIGDFMDGEASAIGIVWGLIGGLFFGIVRWALWVTIMLMVGGALLRTSGTETSWSELGRVIGFAITPGVLSLFTFVPSVGLLFWLVGFLWTLAAVVVGLRQALDFESTGRAVLVAVISGVIAIVPLLIIQIFEWILL